MAEEVEAARHSAAEEEEAPLRSAVAAAASPSCPEARPSLAAEPEHSIADKGRRIYCPVSGLHQIAWRWTHAAYPP